MTGVRFCEDGAEDELAVCCPETRRLMDCTVDMVRTRMFVGSSRGGGWAFFRSAIRCEGTHTACAYVLVLSPCLNLQYATVNGTTYCVALPIFNPVAICYHKGAYTHAAIWMEGMDGRMKTHLMPNAHIHAHARPPSLPEYHREQASA